MSRNAAMYGMWATMIAAGIWAGVGYWAGSIPVVGIGLFLAAIAIGGWFIDESHER